MLGNEMSTTDYEGSPSFPRSRQEASLILLDAPVALPLLMDVPQGSFMGKAQARPATEQEVREEEQQTGNFAIKYPEHIIQGSDRYNDV